MLPVLHVVRSRECVLKHSKLLSLTVRKECFNTLPFFALEEEFHPIGRPFEAGLECASGSRFPLH